MKISQDVRQRFQTAALFACALAAIACTLSKYVFARDVRLRHVTTSDLFLNGALQVSILSAAVSMALSLRSLQWNRLWLILIAVVDLVLIIWTMLPFLGMNY